MKKLLVSACLLGCRCRYDGKSCGNKDVIALKDKYEIIPVCPEQLGGLCTPRNPSERNNGGVFMNDGTDVTDAYRKGAKEALYLARTLGADAAVLKAKSPSCGKGLIYDGSFTGRKIKGNGVTAELLIENGIQVFTEDEITLISEENA
jgi:uncharacterized protein YbbK (DUF523 family)